VSARRLEELRHDPAPTAGARLDELVDDAHLMQARDAGCLEGPVAVAGEHDNGRLRELFPELDRILRALLPCVESHVEDHERLAVGAGMLTWRAEILLDARHVSSSLAIALDRHVELGDGVSVEKQEELIEISRLLVS